MGNCFSVEIVRIYPTYKTKSAHLSNINSSPTSTRAYDIIDREILNLYKVSITSRNSSYQSFTRKEDTSMHNSESYQSLRKKFFEDTH